MLEAKTKEQRDYVEEIVEKHITQFQDGCKFSYAKVYRDCNDVVNINITYEDAELSIDVPFDMMAEIADYLRKENETKTMDKIIAESFTENCTITMPAGQYLTIYKEMQRLERELAWYKEEYEKIKQTVTEVK